MESFWNWWQSLDVQSQAVAIGVTTAVVVGMVKWIPWFAVTASEVKAALAVILAGIGGYVQGGWATAILAVLAALGSYQLYKQTVGKRIFAQKPKTT